MGYFLKHDFHLDWVVVLVLASDEHSGHSNYVEVRHFAGAILVLEVSVQ